MKIRGPWLALCLFLLPISASAGYYWMLHDFTGEEPGMAPGPQIDDFYCYFDRETLPYHVLGTAQVTESGQYRTVDISIVIGGDGVLLIYEGFFNPQDPEANRVAAFNSSYKNYVNDEEWVQLDTGKDYVMVVQTACDPATGISGLSLTGPGEIMGAGIKAPDYAHGNYADYANVADFEDFGTSLYADPYSYVAPRTGWYLFLDAGRFWNDPIGSVTAQRVYSQPFNPDAPQDNLLYSTADYGFTLFLSAGQTVHVVNVDVQDSADLYQTVIFPPGTLGGFNPAIMGAFYNPDQSGQGVLMESDEKIGFVFLALFTFEDQSVAALQNSVGNADQRWLTAFGQYDADSTSIPLLFENATGGSFNQTVPAATIDSDYGSGTLTLIDCNRIEIAYSLPDTPDGVFHMSRALPDRGKECATHIPFVLPEN